MMCRLLLVPVFLVAWLPAGCISSYEVQIIKVHEMIQDMEAIELDQPDHPQDLTETGIAVVNNTDRTLRVKMRGKTEQILSVSPGESSSMALAPGNYHYRIYADETGKEPQSKAITIDLKGTKRIVEKCLYTFDVFTQNEVVNEKELEKLRTR